MKPYPAKKFLPFVLAAFLVGCATEAWVIQKNGQVVSEAELNMDKLRCEREAAATYPYVPVSVSIPDGSSNGSNTICAPWGNTIRCTTSGGGSSPPLVLTRDANSDRRDQFQKSCMAALGYQRIPTQNSDVNSEKSISTTTDIAHAFDSYDTPPLEQLTPSEEQAIIDATPSDNVTRDSLIHVKVPKTVWDGGAVPIEISAWRPFSNGERLYLVVNDSSIAATLTPYDSRTQINLATRVKMPASGLLKAVLVDASGHMRIATRHVEVRASENANQISGRLRFAPTKIVAHGNSTIGNLAIKSWIDSSQNSNRYIKTISYLVDGTKVAEVGLTPASSENPYVEIQMRGSAKRVEMQIRASNGRSNTIATFVDGT